MALWILAQLTHGSTLPPEAAARVLTEVTASNVIAPYMGVFFVAFIVALIFTPLMRMLAVRNGIVDWPDLQRKAHIEPVAYLGGVAIFLGWLAAIGASYFTQPYCADGEIVLSYVLFPMSIIIGAAVIALTGLLDDVYGMSPRVKVGGQLFAAAALAYENVGLTIVADALSIVGLGMAPEWLTYGLGTALIAFFVIGGCNAVNLIDGLDGLASGVVAIACLGFLAIATYVVINGRGDALFDPVRIVMCLAILGAILGFLPYNFNPANIFMGDAGSLLLGYLSVATILLFGHVSGNSLLFITACLIVFAVPISDTALAIFRRKMRGQPIFHPDNQHIHHLLRKSGLSVRQSVLVMYGLSAGFAIMGASLVWMELRWRFILAVFAVVFSFIFVSAFKLGHRQLLLDKQKAGEPLPQPPKPEATSPGASTSESASPARSEHPSVSATPGHGQA